MEFLIKNAKKMTDELKEDKNKQWTTEDNEDYKQEIKQRNRFWKQLKKLSKSHKRKTLLVWTRGPTRMWSVQAGTLKHLLLHRPSLAYSVKLVLCMGQKMPNLPALKPQDANRAVSKWTSPASFHKVPTMWPHWGKQHKCPQSPQCPP